MVRYVKVLAAASVVWGSAGGIAGAVTSYEGKDYSFNFGLRHITACDKESDSTPVKGVYDDNNSGNGIGDVKGLQRKRWPLREREHDSRHRSAQDM